MIITVERIALRAEYTIGKLYIDGQYFCDTLEPTDRGLNDSMTLDEMRAIKVVKKTAIPTGKYGITLNVESPRLKNKRAYAFCGGRVPRLTGLKSFSGVLIHIGNTKDDTAGCILVGRNVEVGTLLYSTLTFNHLYPVLEAARLRGEEIRLKVTRRSDKNIKKR